MIKKKRKPRKADKVRLFTFVTVVILYQIEKETNSYNIKQYKKEKNNESLCHLFF